MIGDLLTNIDPSSLSRSLFQVSVLCNAGCAAAVPNMMAWLRRRGRGHPQPRKLVASSVVWAVSISTANSRVSACELAKPPRPREIPSLLLPSGFFLRCGHFALRQGHSRSHTSEDPLCERANVKGRSRSVLVSESGCRSCNAFLSLKFGASSSSPVDEITSALFSVLTVGKRTQPRKATSSA